MDLRNRHGVPEQIQTVVPANVVGITPQAASAIASQVVGSIAAALALVLGMKLVTIDDEAAAPSSDGPSSST